MLHKYWRHYGVSKNDRSYLYINYPAAFIFKHVPILFGGMCFFIDNIFILTDKEIW